MSAQDINRKVKIDFMGNVRDLVAKLKGVGTEADRTKQKLKQVGDSGATGLNKVGVAAQGAKRDLAATAVAVQGMTASIGGMAQQVLDFESKIIGLHKTIIGVKSQELALQRQQEDLNTAVEEGTIDLRTYNRSIEDIGLAYQNMILEQRNVEAETKKLNGEYVNFGINAVGATAQIVIAFTAMGVSAGTIFPAIVGGIRAVSAALWTVAKHPVFLIITAGILAWELGLKSIVEELTGIDDLGIFSNLEKAFTSLTSGPNSMEELDIQTQNFTNSIQTATPFIEKETEALEKNASAAGAAAEEHKKLSIAQEMVIRNGGFRSGSGTTLSVQIANEADRISVATARTLAAASLHHALKDAGFRGDVRGINISGSANDSGLSSFIRSMGGTSAPGFGPNSGFGPNGTGMFGAESTARFSNGLSLAEAFFRGPHNTKTNISIDGLVNNLKGGLSLSGGGSRGSNFGGRSLTRSGTLSSSRGSGNGKRRGGRNRNPRGRTDKLGVRFGKLIEHQNSIMNKRFGVDVSQFTGVNLGIGGRGGFHFRRFGKNSGLNSGEMANIHRRRLDEMMARQMSEQAKRMNRFKNVTKGTNSMEEALILLNTGFNIDRFATFQDDFGMKDQIQDVIQSRNFFRGKGVDFDGMNKSGISGLLNIREFGYREMNEQLAFMGQEQYQTVGT